MSIQEQIAFITAISPFDRLHENEIQPAVDTIDIAYFKKGDILISRGMPTDYLYIIIKGIVHEIYENEIVSLYVAQDTFDATALIKDVSPHDFIVQEELICYLLPKTVFLSLIQSNFEFRGFYFQNLSSRLNNMIEQRNSKEFSSFMIAKINEVYLHPPLFVEADTSIYQAVHTMKQHKTSYILVKRGTEIGIVTDSNIREHVVLQRHSVDAPVGKIANYQLVSMQTDDFLFNALLHMTKYSIKRMVIYDGQKLVGVLDQLVLLSYFSNHSHLIAVQIEQADNTEQLKKASLQILTVVQSLYAKGVKIRYITQMINELNRKVFEKLYSFIAPPDLRLNSCLLVMGSEGRAEQILKTDQDNAIILRNGYLCADLLHITQMFTNKLIEFGYPACPGSIMVSNPYWVKSLKGFQEQIYYWIDQADEESLMNLAIFYDASAVGGDSTLLEAAKEYLFKTLSDRKIFFTIFAKPVLSFDTPLSLFANFIVDRQHKDQLDIKKGGIFPIMHGVRSLALEHHLTKTNTIERIKELLDKHVLDKGFAIDLIEAYAFMNGLRLHIELEKVKQGEPYDNYVNPDQLNKHERDLLKDSLKIVNSFKKFITYHFKLNMVT